MEHTKENINLMFKQYKGRKFMLENHQKEFMKSIKKFYKEKGFLTHKQFKWLVIYHSEYAGLGDMQPDPAWEK